MDESDRTASLMSRARLPQARPKVAATPAAWLNQMAADAGHLHVRRIGETGEMLQLRATSSAVAAVAAQLKQLSAELPTLDFSLLEPQGWWARTSGKSRSSAAEFAAQFERVAAATGALATVANGLDDDQQARTAPAEQALVELEVECRAVEKIIDQGERWLQDMRSQLNARQAAAADQAAEQAVLEDSHRCDILVDRLKLLRGLCNSAAQIPGQVRAHFQRRQALAQTLQQSVAAQALEWRDKLSVVAAAATTGKAAAPVAQGPVTAHQEFQESVKKAIVACEQLLEQEHELVRSLGALGGLQPPA